VLPAPVVEVAMIYRYLDSARVFCFCSDCCWSL